MKKIYYLFNLLCMMAIVASCTNSSKTTTGESANLKIEKKKRTAEEKAEDTRQRFLYEFNMQKNPFTNDIPRQEKEQELKNALIEKQNNLSFKTNTNSYISRGPSNLGGRTRSIIVDISDNTGNTIIAGGVSSGVFRTTNGGANWTKVSSNSEIHNVTSIAQDTRPGFENIWYYGTGEYRGNSARLGNTNFYGNGIWKSTDSGLTWQQMQETANGDLTVFDNFFDFVIDMEVHPITGELFVATAGKVYRISSFGPVVELELNDDGVGWTDLEITSTGRVYAAIDGRNANNGVYTSASGSGKWEKIAANGTVTDWNAGRRITLALAPSNENILYALYDNGQSNSAANRVSEADLWQYNAATTTWTNYTAKMPDEPGADSNGNDPFSHQGSYDLVVAVKPDNENFVVIGGTNIYKIDNITSDTTFKRIGGYAGPGTYGKYSEGGVDHHPDIHAVAWDLNDKKVMYSGTDGGIHKTNDVSSNFVRWENLNNNYLTYQFYHVNMLNKVGSDYILGGAQDNGTTNGGTDSGLTNKSDMTPIFSGDGAAVATTEVEGIFGASSVNYVCFQNGPFYRQTGGPGTGTLIRPIESIDANNNPVYYPSQFVTYFYMDPDNVSTLYYASINKVLMTNNAPGVTGDSWTLLGSLPRGEEISIFSVTRGAYDPASSYLLIGGKDGSVFKLNDPQNATDLNNMVNITPSEVFTGNASASGQYTSGISVHPTNPDIVMITYASYGSSIKNIFITNNATSATPTWTEVERNLSAHSIRSAAVVEVNGQTQYFVGTARGLYKSNDPSVADWTLEGANEMGIPVVSGLVYRPSDNVMLIGTHGNGMYETNLNASLSIDDTVLNDVNLAMYPNPTQYSLKFASNNYSLNDDTNYLIYDIKGKQIAKGTLKDNSINVATMAKGMYVVTLNNGKKSVSKKFLKN